jgi:hypothetical protein
MEKSSGRYVFGVTYLCRGRNVPRGVRKAGDSVCDLAMAGITALGSKASQMRYSVSASML